MCMGACILHKIQRVVYGASSPKFGSCGGVVDLTTLGPKLRVPSASQRAPTLSSSDTCKLFNHMPIVQGGLLAEESVQLLQECFASKRRDGEGSALQAQDLI
jgi:tRNA(adenine34) deaminase